MSARTIAGMLRDRASAQGEALAIRFYKAEGARGGQGAWEEWTYRRFWEEARRAEAGLYQAGVRPGDRVLLLVPEVREAARCLFGVWALGATPIPVGLPFRLTDVGAFLEQLRDTARRLRAGVILVSRSLAAFAGDADGVRVIEAESLSGDEATPLPDPDDAPGPALIQLTSGSTGRPRGVVLSHERLVLHMASMSEALPSHAASVAVSWLPLHHDMGLIGGLLFPFYNGFVASMLSPQDFRAQPLAWLWAMASLRATICAAPPSAYAMVIRLAGKAKAAGFDLSAWECAMIGAEPISPELLRKFAAAFAETGFRAEAFFPVYGLAEATVAVTFPKLLDPFGVDVIDRVELERGRRAVAMGPSVGAGAGTVELTCVGRPIPGTEVLIVGDDGAPLGDRQVGEIIVRSPTLMQGYYEDAAATSEALRGGWLWTGDLGYQSEGRLFITGRKKELIIRAGHNIVPSLIEDVASGVDGVRSGCVAAVGARAVEDETELVHLVAETKLDPADHPALVQKLRRALSAAGVPVDTIQLVPPGTLPKTTSGKLRRRAVADAIARGAPLDASA